MEEGVQSPTAQVHPESQTPSKWNSRLDLVQRLRDRAYGCKIPDPLVEEAADEIERLRAARKPWKLDIVKHMRLLADSSASGTRLVLLEGADEIERLRSAQRIHK